MILAATPFFRQFSTVVAKFRDCKLRGAAKERNINPLTLLCFCLTGYEGVDSGFAHVIEDEQQFPEYFGHVRTFFLSPLCIAKRPR